MKKEFEIVSFHWIGKKNHTHGEERNEMTKYSNISIQKDHVTKSMYCFISFLIFQENLDHQDSKYG